MQSRSNFFVFFLILTTLLSCSQSKENPEGSLNDVQFAVPATMEIPYESASISFRVQFGKAPKTGDQIVLGSLSPCAITNISNTSFDVNIASLWPSLINGSYDVSIKRGSASAKMGTMQVTVKAKETGVVVEPEDGSTVYGVVMCEGEGVADVSVSDGVEVVRTNKDGIYQLKSKKAHKYVFVSIPSGYETPCLGILPIMHIQLEKSATVAERHDFQLVKAQNQDHHTMLLLGDIHLANRNEDISQFSKFVTDINKQVSATSGPVYALTLGDMTWDLYWKTNTYGYKEYLRDANNIKNLTVYHTIGNHDHSMYEVGDINTVAEYKKVIAPTYYSFNIGKVHYVVLDDVECTNQTATTDEKGNPCYTREYNDKLVQEQIDWLKKDLAYVPKTTPLVVTMHIPMYNASGSGRMSGYSTLAGILDDYPQAHVYTAHTHVIYNVDKTASNHIFEHNAGAICATWWWTSHLTPGVHIGQDGSPGGYTIMDVNGTNLSWQFKGTGSSTDYQFRTYDRNQIFLSTDKYVANGDASHKGQFEPDIWGTANASNEVYINVWNWDPSWKIEVSENGTKLATPTQVTVKDPLHLIAYTAPRLNKNASIGFATKTNSHTFKVKASSASSTLEIKVTDRFGREYTETMTRPKAFTVDQYKIQ